QRYRFHIERHGAEACTRIAYVNADLPLFWNDRHLARLIALDNCRAVHAKRRVVARSKRRDLDINGVSAVHIQRRGITSCNLNNGLCNEIFYFLPQCCIWKFDLCEE